MNTNELGWPIPGPERGATAERFVVSIVLTCPKDQRSDGIVCLEFFRRLDNHALWLWNRYLRVCISVHAWLNNEYQQTVIV